MTHRVSLSACVALRWLSSALAPLTSSCAAETALRATLGDAAACHEPQERGKEGAKPIVDEGITCAGGLILAGSLAIGAMVAAIGAEGAAMVRAGRGGGAARTGQALHTAHRVSKHSLIIGAGAIGAGATGARSEGGIISGLRAAGTSPPFTCRQG